MLIVTGFEGLFRAASVVAFGLCLFPDRLLFSDVIPLGGDLRLSSLGHFLLAWPARFALGSRRHLLLPPFSKVQQVALFFRMEPC